jgi:hypothetical protein
MITPASLLEDPEMKMAGGRWGSMAVRRCREATIISLPQQVEFELSFKVCIFASRWLL